MSTGNTVLITGASTGIGRATAELFHRNGWQVAATMRSPEAGKHLAALDRVAVIKLDVTDEASIDVGVAAAAERFGGIDVLVNNAGFGLYGPLESIPVADLRRQFETNVIGLLAVTRRVTPVFRRQHSGIVVNVSSIAGRITLPLCAPYCGSKFAVEGISEALTYEMSAIGVRVKIVEPGFLKTEFENSAQFILDESLTDYHEIAGKLGQSVGVCRAAAPGSNVAAEVIYRAATDGTDQLRYTAGDDAAAWAALRASHDDKAFFTEMRKTWLGE